MPKLKIKKAPKTKIRRPKASKSWYDKKYSTAELAGKAWSAAKYVATLVNVETKLVDTGLGTVANTQFHNTGNVQYLSGITQGSDYNNRNGNSVKPVFLSFQMNGNRGSGDTAIRIILFRDRENRQAVPAVTDVLETVDVRSNYDHVNLNRFTILKDTFQTLDTYHPTFTFIYSKSMKTHIYYQGTDANVTSADEGALFLLCLSEQASGSASPSANYNSRIGFLDN